MPRNTENHASSFASCISWRKLNISTVVKSVGGDQGVTRKKMKHFKELDKYYSYSNESWDSTYNSILWILSAI